MKVRQRLNLTFVAVVGLMLIPSLYAAVRLAGLRRLAVEERAGHAQATFAVGRLGASVSDLDGYLRSWVAAPGPAQAAVVFATLEDLEAGADQLGRTGYGDTASELERHLAQLRARVEALRGVIEARRLGPATDTVLALGPTLQDVRLMLGEVASSIDLRAAGDFRAAEAISAAAQATTLAAVLAALAIAVTLSWWATESLGNPLARLRRAMADVAGGDFESTWDLPYERPDEIGDLSRSFGTMAERLAELDRLKMEFLAMAGHELKTPLDLISGYAELLEEEHGEGPSGEGPSGERPSTDVLDRIVEQTRVMSRLVSRLMDISRLESGNFGLVKDRVRVEDLLVGLERRFEVAAARAGVGFTVRTAPDVPEWLMVDVDLIRDEVLGNLVANALRMTPEGGEVRVEARGEPGGVLVEVADTGPGIPETHAPFVFDKYYQVRRSRAMGSGLGLAIARNLIEAHGGRIHLADPGEGSGAVFHVFIPAAADDEGTTE